MSYDTEQIKTIFTQKKIKRLQKILGKSEKFRDEITNCEDFMLEDYTLTLRAVMNDVERLSYLLLRLQSLIYSGQTIAKNLGLTEAMEKIIDEVCDTLQCDRASVFMLDELNGQLWSKVAKGSDVTFRMPKDQGIVGSVVCNNIRENIHDAYKDKRFNSTFDQKTGYRTKSILCVPIRDQYGNVIGACQAINKLTKAHFEVDDIYLFESLTTNAGIVLRNSMAFDENVVLQHHLRQLILSGSEMLNKKSMPDFLKQCEKLLVEIFSIQESRVYILNPDNRGLMFRYDETLERREYPSNIGISGYCL